MTVEYVDASATRDAIVVGAMLLSLPAGRESIVYLSKGEREVDAPKSSLEKRNKLPIKKSFIKFADIPRTMAL